MKRPWQVWLVFVLCVAGAAAAMGWLTRQALRADELRRLAESEADLEQRVSLALWRMDTDLAPIIASEVIRDPAMYRTSFFKVDAAGIGQQARVGGEGAPGGTPYNPPGAPNEQTQQLEAAPRQAAQRSQALQLPAGGPSSQPAAGDLMPSPLLLELPPYVVCNFEASLEGEWLSPQVPEGAFAALAAANGLSSETIHDRTARLAELSVSCEPSSLAKRLPESTLPSPIELARSNSAIVNAETIKSFNDNRTGLNLYAGNGALRSDDQDGWPNSPPGDVPVAKGGGKVSLQQPAFRAADYVERNMRYQEMAQQGFLEQRQIASPTNYGLPWLPSEGEAAQRVGLTRPVWLGERLLLARRVDRGSKTYVQGSWMDWSKLKTRLLAQTVDLVANADLVPVGAAEAEDADPGRMLAGLPVRLVVHETASAGGELSPTLRMSLWIGWGALALATSAAAALLWGVMTLSERRAAFVSSVTHELRTPLTTFRMYAEMLARGMVPDGTRRQEYLHTLERESERLTHLVENVLAYSRLERGRRPSANETLTAAALLSRIGPRLAHRAEQAGMQCEIEVDPSAAEACFSTDTGVVEQILFNLVDNASKYARCAANRRIHVVAGQDGPHVWIAVRDHGPGIPRRYQSGRIRPFSKSAEESAETAPGVGLGLSLCKRLARQLGGRLEISPASGGGTLASLFLPV